MRLLSVTLHNIGPFPGTVGPVRLDKVGLVSITGRNEVDPGFTSNDVGKSSFLDGLLWTLFGETAPRKETTTSQAGLNADEIVNELAGKNAVGTVVFEGVDGRTYRVRRWRKCGKAASFRVDGEDITLLKVHGVSFDMVSGPYNTVTPIENLDPTNVQASIDRHLGLDYLLACRVLIRSQEDTFSFGQATPKQRHDLLTEIEGYQEIDAWAEKFKARAQAIAVELAKLDASIQSNKAAAMHLRATDYSLQIQAWENHRAANVANAKLVLESFDGRMAALRTAAAVLPAIQARLQETRVAEASVGYAQKPQDLLAWERRFTELSQAAAVLAHRTKDAQRRLQGFAELKAGTCDKCGQPITGEHLATHRQEAEREAAGLLGEMEGLRNGLVETEAVVKQGQAAFDVHSRGLNEQRSVYAAARGVIEAELRAATQATTQLAAAVADRAKAEAHLAAVQGQENPVIPIKAKNEADAAALEAQVAGQEQARSNLSTEAGLVEWWVRALPSIKAWLFDSACVDITNEANRWLSVFTQGMIYVSVEAKATTKAGEARDRVDVRWIRRMPTGEAREIELRRLGGGAKWRCLTALAWAVAKRAQRRAKTRAGFLALDEVDRHLDDAGRTALMQALNILKAETETLLVITHDAGLKVAADHQWLVTKSREGSRFEVIQ